jgi:hypothetical protein
MKDEFGYEGYVIKRKNGHYFDVFKDGKLVLALCGCKLKEVKRMIKKGF